MKAIKILIAAGIMTGAAQAATITVSAGLTSQGVTPLVSSVVDTSFFVAVGTWDGSAFTIFKSGQDTGEVSGAYTATGPSSFNGQIIALFLGSGTDIASSGTNWAVFKTAANTAFPADVSQATGVTFTMTTPAALTVLATGNVGAGFVAGGVNTNNFELAPIPEPSAALLGAIGALGLLRRRRN